MKFSKLLTALGMLGLAVVLVVLFLRTQTVDWTEHQRYTEAIWKLPGVNADLNKNILKVRFRLLEYYDVLVSEFSTLKALQASLADMPSAIGLKGQGELKKPLDILSVMLQEKEEMLESFKAQNAVLKNSVRYLPSALEEARAEIQDAALVSRLDTLVRDTLHYNRDASRQLEKDITEQVRSLTAIREQYDASAAREALDRTLAHVKTVFTHTPVVNTLTDTLTWMPLAQWSNALGQTYQRHHARVLEGVERDQQYFYLCAAVFLFYILVVMLWPAGPPMPAATVAASVSSYDVGPDAASPALQGNNLAKLKGRSAGRLRAKAK